VRDVEALVGEPLDPQRWRPNIFAAAAPGFTRREPDLVGTRIRVGGVMLRVVDTNHRCVVITYDVTTGEELPSVLGEVARRRDNVVGVYCEVLTPGEIAVGDLLATE
jgi:hypothetical protein